MAQDSRSRFPAGFHLLRRDLFTGSSAYNYASRNQPGVAWLDGKRPSLLVERGTYSLIVLVAYDFQSGKLRERWRWTNESLPRAYRGQGAHWMHAADVTHAAMGYYQIPMTSYDLVTGKR